MDIRNEVINSTQQKHDHVTYNYPDVNITMDIGKYRKKQEDSALFLEHPCDKDIKLLSVADGMGGLENGAEASNLAMRILINWFENMPINNFMIEQKILQLTKDILIQIDEIVRKKCYDGGTTISMAIISKNNTFCFNVGDSRIYIKNNVLKQITNDMNLSWRLYKENIISKDDIRFHKNNNLITSKLGGKKNNLIIENRVLNNNDYENMLLVTDGITDCLTDTQINKIINSVEDFEISSKIVELACDNNSVQNYLNFKDFYNNVNGGKDNATCVTYTKYKRR